MTAEPHSGLFVQLIIGVLPWSNTWWCYRRCQGQVVPAWRRMPSAEPRVPGPELFFRREREHLRSEVVRPRACGSSWRPRGLGTWWPPRKWVSYKLQNPEVHSLMSRPRNLSKMERLTAKQKVKGSNSGLFGIMSPGNAYMFLCLS